MILEEFEKDLTHFSQSFVILCNHAIIHFGAYVHIKYKSRMPISSTNVVHQETLESNKS